MDSPASGKRGFVDDTPMETCKHADQSDKECPPTCECWCDECQERYETAWDRQVQEESLCRACGMPEGDLTFERVAKFQYVHFYLPCVGCLDRYRAFMEKEGLCEGCRNPLPLSSEEACPTCSQHSSAMRERQSGVPSHENRPPTRYGERPDTPRPPSQDLSIWTESLDQYTGVVADSPQQGPSHLPNGEPSNE